MSKTHASPAPLDVFDALDVCHRQSLIALGQLAALMTRLARGGPDDEARALARQVLDHFSVTMREHHEDEERHVFPSMAASRDPAVIEAIERLTIDHRWLDEDWRELHPQLDAIASGQSWYDPDALREGADIFAGLLQDHIALEESFIYPLLRGRLMQHERYDMGREMAARRRAERTPGS